MLWLTFGRVLDTAKEWLNDFDDQDMARLGAVRQTLENAKVLGRKVPVCLLLLVLVCLCSSSR